MSAHVVGHVPPVCLSLLAKALVFAAQRSRLGKKRVRPYLNRLLQYLHGNVLGFGSRGGGPDAGASRVKLWMCDSEPSIE